MHDEFRQKTDQKGASDVHEQRPPGKGGTGALQHPEADEVAQDGAEGAAGTDEEDMVHQIVPIREGCIMSAEPLGVPPEMVVHEGRDEIIGMVVTLVHSERKPDVRSFDGFFEQPWAQTVFEEAIRLALVDQEFREAGAVLDERAGIYSRQAALSGPRYFSKAPTDQSAEDGATIGAKAEQLLKRPGCLRATVMAPCPPIEWPKIP